MLVLVWSGSVLPHLSDECWISFLPGQYCILYLPDSFSDSSVHVLSYSGNLSFLDILYVNEKEETTGHFFKLKLFKHSSVCGFIVIVMMFACSSKHGKQMSFFVVSFYFQFLISLCHCHVGLVYFDFIFWSAVILFVLFIVILPVCYCLFYYFSFIALVDFVVLPWPEICVEYLISICVD